MRDRSQISDFRFPILDFKSGIKSDLDHRDCSVTLRISELRCPIFEAGCQEIKPLGPASNLQNHTQLTRHRGSKTLARLLQVSSIRAPLTHLPPVQDT